MALEFAESAWEDFLYWQTADSKILKRISRLIRAVQREPCEGIGKPEPLRGDWSGFWSRRIDSKHRLVYAVEEDDVLIAQIIEGAAWLDSRGGVQSPRGASGLALVGPAKRDRRVEPVEELREG